MAFSELLGEEILWGETWNTVSDTWLSAAEIVSRLENPWGWGTNSGDCWREFQKLPDQVFFSLFFELFVTPFPSPSFFSSGPALGPHCSGASFLCHSRSVLHLPCLMRPSAGRIGKAEDPLASCRKAGCATNSCIKFDKSHLSLFWNSDLKFIN